MGHSSIRTAVSVARGRDGRRGGVRPHLDMERGRVTDMGDCSRQLWEVGAGDFNEPIGNWDVHKVKNMENMFERGVLQSLLANGKSALSRT